MDMFVNTVTLVVLVCGITAMLALLIYLVGVLIVIVWKEFPGRSQMNKTPAQMLREFHARSGNSRPFGGPTANAEGLLARVDYLEEEVRELREAIVENDVIAVADALGDIGYLLYGTGDRTGIDVDRVLREIHSSNMTKTPVPGDGKAIKGPDYYAPWLTMSNIGFIND